MIISFGFEDVCDVDKQQRYEEQVQMLDWRSEMFDGSIGWDSSQLAHQ